MAQTQVESQAQAPILQIKGRSDNPILEVNDGVLEPEQVGYLKPTDPQTTSMDEMRQRLKEDGYVFLKGVLPREDVLKARRQYFEHLVSTGLLEPKSDPVDGLFDLTKDRRDYPGVGAGVLGWQSTDTETCLRFQELALKAHSEHWYKEVFCKHPALLDFVAKFSCWGKDTLAVQRTLLRNNVPGNKAIGVHYDLIFLRHGEDSVLTTWVPIGDVKVEGGGLIYLEKGHELGRKIEQDFTDRAKAGGLTEEEAKNAFNKNMMDGGVITNGTKEFSKQHNRRWLVTNYEAGDVVLHDSYSIHASTINRDESGAIRLGTDLRFVDSSKSWDKRWDKVYDYDDGI